MGNVLYEVNTPKAKIGSPNEKKVWGGVFKVFLPKLGLLEKKSISSKKLIFQVPYRWGKRGGGIGYLQRRMLSNKNLS